MADGTVAAEDEEHPILLSCLVEALSVLFFGEQHLIHQPKGSKKDETRVLRGGNTRKRKREGVSLFREKAGRKSRKWIKMMGISVICHSGVTKSCRISHFPHSFVFQ